MRIQSILLWHRWRVVSDGVAKWPPLWVIQWWQFSEQCVYSFLCLLHLLLCFSLRQKQNMTMSKKKRIHGDKQKKKIYKCEQLTLCVFCCSVVTMAVSTWASEEWIDFVSELCCSFISERAPCSLALSSELRLSPRSDKNSSTERIVSFNKSLLIWRSFSTSYSANSNNKPNIKIKFKKHN